MLKFRIRREEIELFIFLFLDMSKIDRASLFSRMFFFSYKFFKILKNPIFSFDLECEFFIDYRSSQDGCDRSLRLGKDLKEKYGANIVEHPQSSTTTHIIFKNGHFQTKLFAKKHQIPLIDPMWLEYCIKKRKVAKYDKYLVVNDENEQPKGKYDFF